MLGSLIGAILSYNIMERFIWHIKSIRANNMLNCENYNLNRD
jgi:hypothetical protein